MANVVVCPDAYKGGPDAAAVAAALARGWRTRRTADRVDEVPLADGGEGTLDALAGALNAGRRVAEGVVGPDGRTVDAPWLLTVDRVGVIELAASSGLPMMARLDPLHATSRGVGQVIAAALDAGAQRLLVGLGGSASTDGGAGMLAALGARFSDANGRELADGGGALTDLASVDLSRLRTPPSGGVEVLSDVTSPLLGPSGAAAVFGPQKGASPDDIRMLETGLRRLANCLGADPDLPGAGAGGGVGYGLVAAWGARIRPGSEAIAEEVRLDERLADADLVITGEGAFDRTSLAGKVVGEVVARARDAGVAVVVVAGAVDDDAAAALPEGVDTVSLTEVAGSVEASLARPEHVLEQVGRELASTW